MSFLSMEKSDERFNIFVILRQKNWDNCILLDLSVN